MKNKKSHREDRAHRSENPSSLLRAHISRLCLGGALAAVTLPVYAQQSQQPAPRLEEVITIGTRIQGRTVTDTAVPVDVLSPQELKNVPSADISDVMSKLIPSFDIAANPVNEGSSHIRPSTLRGMDSDKALILVNGKRRHRSSVIFMAGWGGHGPDLNPIPSIALKSVEVLRDGASALYGSDAIAGVMNFNLKDASDGGSISLQGGQYTGYEHEGNYQAAANKGFALGENGFVNVSVEWAKRERADRVENDDRAIAQSGLVPSQAANTVMRNAVSVDGIPLGTRYGPDALTERDFNRDGVIDSLIFRSDGIPDDPDTRFKDNLKLPETIYGATPQESKKVFINAGYTLNDNMKLYAFGNYMTKQSDSSFFYRSPSASQLAPIRLQNGTIWNPRTALYPGGFTPRFYGDVEDYSLTTGLRGEFGGSGILYDFSGRYGVSKIGYDVKGSMNPSMGPDTPTNFHPGDLENNEKSFNADLSRPFEVGWYRPLNVAVGFEWRDEGYKISQGDPLSYYAGPYSKPDPWNFEITQREVDANPNDNLTQIGCRIPGLERVGQLCPTGDPINNAAAVGSNGFPGYAPEFNSNYHRTNTAVYLTLESDITEKFFGSVAGRFEDFEDFGSNFSWRTAGRYSITDKLALRASVGTGFKAPTPGQISTTNVSTTPSDGQLVQRGIFPATHPASVLFGAKPLEPEKAFSYTGGITFEPLSNLTLTLDYYFIQLKNRLTFSGTFVPTRAQQDALAAMNIAGAETIQQVQFFTNDAETETTGFDFVTDYRLDWAWGTTTFSYRGNWNQTEITKRPLQANGRPLIDDARKYLLEHTPGYRAVWGVNHAWDKFNVDVRVNTYGSWSYANTTLTQFEYYRPTHQVDASVGWNVTDSITATLGGRNVFDKYPQVAQLNTCCGRIYPETAADWFGRYVYLNLNANF